MIRILNAMKIQLANQIQWLLLIFQYISKMGHGLCQSEPNFQQETESFNPITGYMEKHHNGLLVENITCYNFEDMISTKDMCQQNPCSMNFIEKNITTVRTNSFIGFPKLELIKLPDSNVQILQTGAFSGLLKVKEIQLQNNSIEKITRGVFNSLIDLRKLNLAMNNIGVIEDESFHGTNSLEYLDLSYNKLSFISESIFQHTESLRTLNISSNILTSEVLQQLCYFTNLETLILDKNNVDKIADCFMNLNITFLSMSRNSLNYLRKLTFPQVLRKLYLSDNKISKLDSDTFNYLSKLEELDISDNSITTLPLGIFKDLKCLKILDLSENQISVLNYGIFGKLQNLKILNISHNYLDNSETDIFIPLSSLRTLDVSHNNFKFFNMTYLFKFSYHLTTLIVDGNQFSCQDLATILYFSRKNGKMIPHGNTLDSENINGIACSENLKEIDPDDSGSSENLETLKGNFEKLSELSNKLTKSLTMLQETFEHLSARIEKLDGGIQRGKPKQNQFLTSINNISTGVLSENLFDFDKKHFADDSKRSDFFNKNGDEYNSNKDTNREMTDYAKSFEIFFKNLSNFLSSMEEKKIHTPQMSSRFEELKNEPSNDDHNNSVVEEIATETRNLVSIFSQLRLFVVLIILISLSLCTVKLVKQWRNLGRQGYSCSNIEMPILRDA